MPVTTKRLIIVAASHGTGFSIELQGDGYKSEHAYYDDWESLGHAFKTDLELLKFLRPTENS